MAYKVYLSPSSQVDNHYATGGENESHICGEIAVACEKALNRCGIQTKIGHNITLNQKCSESDAFGANLHVPIHTNAASNGTQTSASGTRIYAMQKGANGWKASECIQKYLGPLSPGAPDLVKEETTWQEIRVPKASTTYIEVDFHDNPKISPWLIQSVVEIGEAIAHGICDYFGVAWKAAAVTAPVQDDKESLPTNDKDAFLALLRENREEVIKILFGI